MKEVYEFLKKSGTYYLATIDGEKPRVRPFGTIDLFDGKLYFQTGKSKDVSKQIALNPKIEISSTVEDSWIRIEATAVDDDNRAAKVHMLEEYPSLKELYSPDDDNTQVFYLKDATATIYSFTDEPKVIKF